MCLHSQIEAAKTKARREKDDFRVTLYSTVMAEAQRGDPKFVGGQASISDEAFVKAIKKLITSANEVLQVQPENDQAKKELAILQPLLPKQLTEEDLVTILWEHPEFKHIKDFMTFLKSEHPGLYDGKLASTVFGKMGRQST